MKQTSDDRCGVPPLRRFSAERVLLPGGAEPLTLAGLEERCLARMAKLVAETAVWPSGGFRETWRLGDFNILIVETTAAPKAELYVQFWSEPGQPAAWEVSSGHANPPLRRFLTRRARAALGEMGFAIGGGANNFRKAVTVANQGDAASVAREVLRIFHDALGYRGATPLVARVIRGSRSGRAVAHTIVTLDDTVTLLRQMGYETRVFKRSRRPVVGGRFQGFEFAVTLDVPGSRAGEFQCLDFIAAVGRIEERSHAAWGEALNRLNGRSRVARGWIDQKGYICVGTSLTLVGGMTEAGIEHAISGWYRAAVDLRGGPPKPKRGKRTKPSEADDDPFRDEDDPAPPSRPVVH